MKHGGAWRKNRIFAETWVLPLLLSASHNYIGEQFETQEKSVPRGTAHSMGWETENQILFRRKLAVG